MTLLYYFYSIILSLRSMKFTLLANDPSTEARAATLTTDHGTIETPIFMPVGTAATVKGVHQRELKNDINPDIILGLTFPSNFEGLKLFAFVSSERFSFFHFAITSGDAFSFSLCSHESSRRNRIHTF